MMVRSKVSRLGHGIRYIATFVSAVALSAHAIPARAETRDYVVNWFYQAQFSDGKTDCPDGMNPPSLEFYRRDLLRVGHPVSEVDTLLKDYPEGGGRPWTKAVSVRGNGKDNVWMNPTTAPDPNLKLVQSKFAYGFNLDGKKAASPNSFEEPDTHELGVNNQLYRATGCIRSYRGVPDHGRAVNPETEWEQLRAQMPAWLISVTVPDGGKDGDAVVTLDRATETITRDTSGTNVQPDMTYHADPNLRSRNVLHGRVEKGVVTTEPANIHFVADPYLIAALDLSKAKLRLEFKPDGSVFGLIGGYQPWYPVYHASASEGSIVEYATSVDIPGLYYALKKCADADPDPKTGENRAISSAFFITGVSAFVVPATTRSAQAR
jgi:hypothetical protein